MGLEKKQTMFSTVKVGEVLFALCLALCMTLAEAQAAERVLVFVDASRTNATVNVKETARDEAFVEGVLQAAKGMLLEQPSMDRWAVFRQWIEPQATDLVLGYSELAYEKYPDTGEAMLELDVLVNEKLLKEKLKDIGLVYNFRESTKIVIRQQADEDIWPKLDKLQTLYGLEAVGAGGDSSVPRLDLKKKAKVWHALLHCAGREMEAFGPELDEVFADLWPGYFRLPEVVAGTVATVRFTMGGWYVTSGVREFDREMKTWKSLVEDAALIRLDMGPVEQRGLWEVSTIRPAEFLVRVESYARDRGLEFSGFVPGGGDKEDDQPDNDGTSTLFQGGGA